MTQKNRHLLTIVQLCHAISSQPRHVLTIGKILVKHQYLRHMSSQYGKLRPTNCWDRFGCLGHPSKFQRVSCLALVTAATSLTGGQPSFALCLAVSLAGTLFISWLLLRSYLYHCVWSVIIAHNLIPVNRDNNYSLRRLTPTTSATTFNL